MVVTCLNCGSVIPDRRKDEEFCLDCQEDLDKMVDSRSMLQSNEVEMEQNFNPFFENPGRMTGGIRSPSKDSVGARIVDEGGSSFLNGLLVISVLMSLMVIYFLYLN